MGRGNELLQWWAKRDRYSMRSSLGHTSCAILHVVARLAQLGDVACFTCRVSIFVVATEDAGKGCQIMQVKGPAPEAIPYEKRVSCLPRQCCLCCGVFSC